MRTKNNFIIDPSAKQLTFLDSRFYWTEANQFLPSVTTILEAYPKGAGFYQWLKENGSDADAIRDEAGTTGSIVHHLTEKYDNGETVTLLDENGNISLKVNEWAMFERYVEFVNRFKPEHEMIEQNFVSESLGYAGTVDRITMLDGKRILLDIKTSGAIYPSYWLQLAAYANLFTKETSKGLDQVGILWLNAKTRTDGKKGAVQGIGWQLITKTFDESLDDLNLFNITHKLWLAENEAIKPRMTTYSLSHKKINADGVTVPE